MIEIYTKPNCSYCVHAKKFMSDNLLEYVEYKLDKDFVRDDVLNKFPTAKTYPIIVIDGNYIGGFTDLKKIHEEKNVQS
jgi:glutaredoxin